ncbi:MULTISPECIES: hypothetical protein [unclassified Nocardioides]|uniref:hypothetical protein n=1 Tax=unclassified Nocardioides TaxID=2615069 RepID=UPI0036166F11
MSGKLWLLAGAAVGYVLGARAGRERYDQIAAKAQSAWRDPRVQEKVGQAQDVAKEKAGQAAHEVAERAGHAQQALKDKVASPDGADATPTPGSPTERY